MYTAALARGKSLPTDNNPNLSHHPADGMEKGDDTPWGLREHRVSWTHWLSKDGIWDRFCTISHVANMNGKELEARSPRRTAA